ncbi:hypothetical protein H4W31_000848 [Plantactinospora soyae]|uniref:Uncharacterized protein n=1 Tax=Plantactinospora soyae TaxID=1544732 RepID=A0A927M1Q4_9ACTN|nr:hypothetical protein [Plantactinospora soyae]
MRGYPFEVLAPRRRRRRHGTNITIDDRTNFNGEREGNHGHNLRKEGRIFASHAVFSTRQSHPSTPRRLQPLVLSIISYLGSL